MQVRKFEAKTMKDALELVKQHLGPEAIILSAKDNSRGFGLMGEKSVEVTAAVSEETLRRKRMAETKLRESAKERFANAPARVQKQFINKVFDRAPEPVLAAVKPAAGPAPAMRQPSRPPSGQRYIDIVDEELNQSTQRIREAALRARSASHLVLSQQMAPQARPETRLQQKAASAAAPTPALTAQIDEIKTLIEKFHASPQSVVSPHPGAEDGLPFELSQAYEGLRWAGLQLPIIVDWLKMAKSQLDRESLRKDSVFDAWLVQKIFSEAKVVVDPKAGRYHVFVGTTAQGKTSTLVKMASSLVLKEKRRIALISLDTVKVGAADQLKIYAQILNVPFAVVRRPSEWRLLEEKIKDVDHILVDAPGLNLKTEDELMWIKSILPPSPDRRLHFVQSALARDEECLEIAGRYRAIGFDDVIFTRMDESVRHGLLLNFQRQMQTPIHSFGTGPVIPEDFEWASKERIADLIFHVSKNKKREVIL